MLYKYTIDGIYKVKGINNISGEVSVSGSKNASLPLMVASLLTDEPVILHNIPNLLDVQVLIKILEDLGKVIKFENNTLIIENGNNENCEASYKLVKKMRGSIMVLGPLIAKRKYCKVSYPGGCAFGPRPIDLHLMGLEKLGASIRLEEGYIKAYSNKLVGSKIDLSGKYGSTVLGTDNILMASTLAKGETIIKNAAFEPECDNLANMLIKMGAKIEGVGTNTLKINGVESLKGVEYSVIPDRIEAGTYIALALATKANIKIKNVEISHLHSVINVSKSIGAKIEIKENMILVDASKNNLKPFKIETLPYPNFPTDLQSIFTAVACTINGRSYIKESVFPDRFTHISELNRMRANVNLNKNTIVIDGGKCLSGADVQASDLRAGASLIVAASASRGISNIHRIYHIERGYENIEDKLRSLNVNITKKEDDIL